MFTDPMTNKDEVGYLTRNIENAQSRVGDNTSADCLEADGMSPCVLVVSTENLRSSDSLTDDGANADQDYVYYQEGMTQM